MLTGEILFEKRSSEKFALRLLQLPPEYGLAAGLATRATSADLHLIQRVQY